MPAKTRRPKPIEKQKKILCDDLGYAGLEAYKQLRTSILFSIPASSGSKCKIIGVTSAEAGDGKSTTSVNLAYVLAATKARVLLIEGDMRLPLMAKRLNLKETPGLSNLLVGSATPKKTFQIVECEYPFYAITAGEFPPNPSELLSSKMMGSYIEAFKELFDYIIWDLPPVNAVTDAASVAQQVDGYVVVVRQNQTSARDIDAALDKLKMVNGKILGFVQNGVAGSRGKYNYYY